MRFTPYLITKNEKLTANASVIIMIWYYIKIYPLPQFLAVDNLQTVAFLPSSHWSAVLCLQVFHWSIFHSQHWSFHQRLYPETSINDNITCVISKKFGAGQNFSHDKITIFLEDHTLCLLFTIMMVEVLSPSQGGSFIQNKCIVRLVSLTCQSQTCWVCAPATQWWY